MFFGTKGGGGAPPTGWPYTTQSGHPDSSSLLLVVHLMRSLV